MAYSILLHAAGTAHGSSSTLCILTYQNGELIPTTNELIKVAHQGALDDMLKNTPIITSGDISKETLDKTIFIPEMNLALKNEKPFVFDLTSCSLVSIPIKNKFNTEKFHNYLMKTGKGDIAWDGSILTTRGISAHTIVQEIQDPCCCGCGRVVPALEYSVFHANN